MQSFRFRIAVVGMALALAACGSDSSFEPTVESVAGTYSAETFTLTSSVGSVDLLALGAEVSADLDADGTTTGRLFVPGGAEGGGDLDEDLIGTWDLSGQTVTFNQSADTFIRDAEFTATEGRLTGEGTFGGQAILLVLVKAE